MLVKYAITYYYLTINNLLLPTLFDHPEGESMKVGFDGGINLGFHSAKVTFDSGFLTYRDHHVCETGWHCTFLQLSKNIGAVD